MGDRSEHECYSKSEAQVEPSQRPRRYSLADAGTLEKVDPEPIGKLGIAAEYEALDQFQACARQPTSTGAAIVQQSAAQVAKAAVKAAMVLEDEGRPDSTAGVIR